MGEVHSTAREPRFASGGRRSHAIRVLCASAVAALTACGAGTEPDRSFTVAVSAPASVAVVLNGPASFLRVSCRFTITARATGGGAGDHATWDGASIDVDDGATLRPLMSWSASEVAALFGADRISAGSVQTGSVRVDSNADRFPVTHTFRYRLASGAVETAAVTTTCG